MRGCLPRAGEGLRNKRDLATTLLASEPFDVDGDDKNEKAGPEW